MVYTFVVIPYSSRTRSQIHMFNVLYYLHDQVIS